MSEPTDKDFASRNALHNNEADFDIMFGIGDGRVSPNAFFASENVRRILRGEKSEAVTNIMLATG